MLHKEGYDAIQYAKKIAEDSGMNYEGVIVEGAAAHEILKFAKQNNVDMINNRNLGQRWIRSFSVWKCS